MDELNKLEEKRMNDINLPAVIHNTSPALIALTQALGVPRDVIASDDEIQAAWGNLPRAMQRIPPELRDKGMARMCVAVASGLFDSAINYVWNASEVELRNKIKRFGLNVVEQVTTKKDFDESKLNDLKSAELLSLCLQLNLITEDGYFFLDQCRDIRNNFSAAHPTIGDIDDHEFIVFVSRCAKYALGNEQNPVGVDIQGFMNALKVGRFSQEQANEWIQRLNNTHQAQRELLFGSMHGIYCDPSSSEEARLNALGIVQNYRDTLSPATRSQLIDRHQDYIAGGDGARHKASQQFFEKLGLLGLLGDSERHALISNACKRLMGVHQAYDNFYNEPPFAERVFYLVSDGAIPDTAKNELVTTVVTCAVGNQYGISNAATPFYHHIIRNFSPAEVSIMLTLSTTTDTILGHRVRSYPRCHSAFKELAKMINPSSVPTATRSIYEQWLR
ncbi:hypothetical protein [Oleiagrimonas soli]|uniref:Uncharacterized protein n=1 Tax=Oleiagrimonas soli TaxID=1543381 RepID=A0A841KIR7_9GAMM|nr:hypothetical protein [Oleiagrimonas soli]MBB6184860.1 hypothetical protein [Oleiagrimonas soli]